MIKRKLALGLVTAMVAIGCVACGGSDDDSAADEVDESTEEASEESDVLDDAEGAELPEADVDDDTDTKTVPDGWPDFLAIPDGFTIEVSQSRTMSDGRDLSLVEALGDGDPGDIFATYEAAVTAAGFEIQFQNDLDEVYILTSSDGEWTAEVTVEESPQVPGKTLVSLKYVSEL